ncbi:MAG: hypothetical protein DI598_20460 [Pseudopedobacter saltans]|uniref:Host-nuclease inhibitor protein Gam n=1 Tax=Pseudopedobacter saltans TaxID=151895 RepID=A0A2W5FZT2_9SPHI|nr:MAG: hypothetical protein DI598_20460 [Pseudopedobacter saltans]
MARTAKKTNVNVTLSEAQAAAHIYADITIQKENLENEMKAKIAAIRAEYEPDITDLDGQLAEPYDILESYAKETKDGWDKKSLELAACTIGFRTTPPSVGKIKGVTWDGIISLLKGKKNLKQFVAVKEAVDKAAILKVQTDAKIMRELTTIGVTIEQSEQFFVEEKKEKVAA